MDKYFLMGLDAVEIWKDKSAQGLIDSLIKFDIVKYNERTSLIEDLAYEFIKHDGYVQIFYNDVKEIEVEGNKKHWNQFFEMIDPESNMNDGEVIDYMIKYYKVPEFLNLDEL